MLRNTYKEAYEAYFARLDLDELIDKSKVLVQNAHRIFFIGNGGSNSVCSHMMEDFGKMLRKQTFSFSDASLITCYANDYGYEHAFSEWLKLYEATDADLLVAISSSGKSINIINAVNVALSSNCPVITLSGFDDHNPLSKLGRINMHVDSHSYGIVETMHQVFIHTILDECYEER
ncbi:MAG: SIS domain-containing protein [Salibacteraceae bacterium]